VEKDSLNKRDAFVKGVSSYERDAVEEAMVLKGTWFP
jgi:hypothetical protein